MFFRQLPFVSAQPLRPIKPVYWGLDSTGALDWFNSCFNNLFVPGYICPCCPSIHHILLFVPESTSRTQSHSATAFENVIRGKSWGRQDKCFWHFVRHLWRRQTSLICKSPILTSKPQNVSNMPIAMSIKHMSHHFPCLILDSGQISELNLWQKCVFVYEHLYSMSNQLFMFLFLEFWHQPLWMYGVPISWWHLSTAAPSCFVRHFTGSRISTQE